MVQVTFTTLIDGNMKMGDLPAARQLWADMLQSGVKPNAATFNTLLTGLAASPDPESLQVGLKQVLLHLVLHFANFLRHPLVQMRSSFFCAEEGLSSSATAQDFLFEVMHV